MVSKFLEKSLMQPTATQTKTSRSNKFLRSFVEHPASVNESYLQHFCFALRFAARLFAASMAAVIHALIPALCETTASRLVQSMHADIQKRHAETEA